jgi:hypothetical protein
MGLTQSRKHKKIVELNTDIDKFKNVDEFNEIQELRNQLTELKNIDKNHDNMITKEEVNAWIKIQKSEIEDFKQKIKADLAKEKNIEFEAKYIEMQKRIDSLQAINLSLEKKIGSGGKIDTKKSIIKDIDQSKNQSNKSIASNISQEQIDIFVERLLNDSNVNIKYLPDFVERQLYRNMFTIFLGVIQNLSDTTEIKFLGHKMTLHMIPDDTPAKSTTTNASAKRTKEPIPIINLESITNIVNNDVIISDFDDIIDSNDEDDDIIDSNINDSNDEGNDINDSNDEDSDINDIIDSNDEDNDIIDSNDEDNDINDSNDEDNDINDSNDEDNDINDSNDEDSDSNDEDNDINDSNDEDNDKNSI